jgi:hypothetical protein
MAWMFPSWVQAKPGMSQRSREQLDLGRGDHWDRVEARGLHGADISLAENLVQAMVNNSTP